VHARTLSDDRHFPGFVLDELRRVGLSPRSLSVELLVPRDLSPALLDALAQLRAVGISIGIDDVGLSSTDYEGLVECQPDYLKIDRCFVRTSLPDDLRDVMLESVVRLGQGIGAATIAEGVETRGELDAVRRQGIRLVQGNLMAAPMTATQLIATGLLQGNVAACG
jgi:EAL domain-containing protein (putative c-di-GMP-specific phosphodiesterase class I)